MPTFRFTVVDHDPVRPWLVVGETQHLTVNLERASDFAEWAAEHWARDRFTVELEPGQGERQLKY